MDTLKLDQAVGELTRWTKHRVEDPDGGWRWIEVPPLLAQLRSAIYNTTAPAWGGSGSSGNPLPLSADALDLLNRIQDTASANWWLFYRDHWGHGRESTEGRIRAWAAAARKEPEALRQAERLTCGWVASIRALFEPRRTWEIKGACPVCGERKVSSQDEDGHTIVRPALAVVYAGDDLAGAECAACGEDWPAGQLEDLARMIAGQDDGGGAA